MATLAETVAGLSGTHATAGDSIAQVYSLDPPVDMTGWQAAVQVRLVTASTAALTQTISTLSADKLSLVGLMQTTTLAAGKYLVVARLTKAATSERKEIVSLLKLSASEYV